MKFSPSNVQLLTAGYVAIPATMSLFSHPDWPGFIFKKVTTLNKAIAAGGIMITNASYHVGYIGRSALNAYNRDLFGKIKKPTTTRAILCGRAIDRWNNGSVYQHDIVVTYGSFGYHDIIAENDTTAVAVAIVTKARDGHVFSRRTGAAVAFLAPGSAENGLPLVPGGDANVPNYPGISIYGHALTVGYGVSFALPDKCGFIGFSTLVPVREWFAPSKQRMLDVVDEDVKEYYSIAFDEQLNATTSSEPYDVRLAVHLQADGKWGGQYATTINGPQSANYSGSICCRYGPSGNGTAAPATSHTWSAFFPMNERIASVPYDDLPLLEMRPTTTAANGAGISAAFTLKSPAAVSAQNIVSFDASLLKLSNTQPAITPGSIIPAWFPRSAPATTLTAGLTVDLLAQQYVEYVNMNVISVGDIAMSTDISVPATVLTNITKKETELTARRDTLEKLRPSMSRNAAAVDLFVSEVDKRVKDMIG